MGKIAKNFEDYMEALRKADTAHWQSEKIPCEKVLCTTNNYTANFKTSFTFALFKKSDFHK